SGDVTLTAYDGDTEGRRTMIQRSTNTIKTYDGLQAYGVVKFEAADGYGFSCITFENDCRYSSFITGLKLAEGETGSLERTSTSAPHTLTWTADDINPDKITFTTGNSSATLTRIHVELKKRDTEASVDEIKIEDNTTPAEYYTIQGIRLKRCPDKGIFIEKHGDRVKKVIK
ncbi:MAG: hypothetical protein K2I52_05205, partial [Muribaculaceae bacterium]|nr:hypothetical protein [Muribaculaceae bacterium]